MLPGRLSRGPLLTPASHAPTPFDAVAVAASAQAAQVRSRELPIGVFDSGIGGLTVLRALRSALPDEHLLYLGDTARVPYGTRSPETVLRYSQRVAGHLYGRGIKALVIACNTATTYGLAALQQAGAERGVPVIGVIEPGVERALALTKSGHVGVIGTEGTVRGGVYTAELRARRPSVQVSSVACPLFVALAEEGWLRGEVVRLVAERYLERLRGGPDTLVLGCTHYPLLAEVIAEVLPGVTLVDSADAVAAATARLLAAEGLLRGAGPGQATFLVTDNLERFLLTGEIFLGARPEPAEQVDISDEDGLAFAPRRRAPEGGAVHWAATALEETR